MNNNEWFWGEPEVKRIELLAKRIIHNAFHGLQSADVNDIIGESICLALSVHFDSPERYNLNYRFVKLCVRTAGVRLGFLAKRNEMLPDLVSLSDADIIPVEFIEIGQETHTADIINLLDWKTSHENKFANMSG